MNGCANKGGLNVESEPGVRLPALLELLRPEDQQPGHDDKHADPDEELDVAPGELDECLSRLCITEREGKHVPSCII